MWYVCVCVFYICEMPVSNTPLIKFAGILCNWQRIKTTYALFNIFSYFGELPWQTIHIFCECMQIDALPRKNPIYEHHKIFKALVKYEQKHSNFCSVLCYTETKSVQPIRIETICCSPKQVCRLYKCVYISKAKSIHFTWQVRPIYSWISKIRSDKIKSLS